jgi:hypothetical protein
VSYTIDPAAVVGDFVGTFILDESFVSVAPPDLALCLGCPFDTYVPSTKTEIVTAPTDLLIVDPVDIAPTTVMPGDLQVPVMELDLSATANDVDLTDVRVDLTGTGADADIAAVSLWLDNGDGAFGAGDTALDTGAFAGATVNLAAGVTVVAGTPEILFVTYDIAAGATVGAFVGAFVNNGSLYFPVAGPDLSSCPTCPVDTYVPGLQTEIIAPNAPPEAGGLTVEGFADGTPGILHILPAAPMLAWTYSDPTDAQVDYEVQVGSAPGSFDLWNPPPAGSAGLSVAYGGAPLSDSTDYYFSVRVHDGFSWSPWNETRFHMNGVPPLPATPTPGNNSLIPTNASQTVSWTPVIDPDGDPVTYDWAVATDPAFTNIVRQNSTTGTTSDPFATSPGTTYYWRVAAHDDWEGATGATDWRFITEGINAPPDASGLGVANFLDGTPGILHITVATPVLNWTYTDTENDAQTDYQVQVGTTPGGSEMWAPPAAGAAGLSVAYGGSALVDGNDYYFAVRVHDGRAWSSWTEVRFHTNTPPPAPTLTTPANNTAGVALGAVGLAWLAVTDAEGDTVTYDWFVSTSPTFGSLSGSGTGGLTATFTSNSALQVYYWRVSAYDGWEDGEVSGWFTFTMGTAVPTSGSIAVTVLGAGNAPVANASVQLVNSGGTVVQTLTTGSTGVVTFQGVALGNYSVRVTATGFQSGSATVSITTGDPDDAVTVVLTSGEAPQFPWWILGVLIALVLAVLLILFLLMRRRKQKEEPEAGMAPPTTTAQPGEAMAPPSEELPQAEAPPEGESPPEENPPA